jgi:hypothetical protein
MNPPRRETGPAKESGAPAFTLRDGRQVVIKPCRSIGGWELVFIHKGHQEVGRPWFGTQANAQAYVDTLEKRS